MSLIVLTDEQVKSVLDNLTTAQLDGFQSVLSKALHEYSTNAELVKDGSYHQPQRTHYSNPRTGATTLFMPSISPNGMGIKVVTLSTPSKGKESERPAGVDAQVIRPTGAVTVFGSDGRPRGFLHAGALTAFRTALASSCLLSLRGEVRDLVVFGTGKQAYWHLRLSLIQYGSTIRSITVVNRNGATARQLLGSLDGISAEVKAREGWQSPDFSVLSPGSDDYEDGLKRVLQKADVVFCCTPSTEDLFSGDILMSHEGRMKTRLIIAVGSYAPHMRELPEGILLQATAPGNSEVVDGGVVMVDTVQGVMTEAGEIIHSQIKPNQLLELGEILTLHEPQNAAQDNKSARSQWLREGNVIYKSVGLGLMDLVVATHLIDVAAELKLGTCIEGFDA